MSNHPEHISDEEKKLFEQLDVNFSKSKADVWAMIEERTTETSAAPKQGKVVSMRKYWLAAAGLAILMGIVGFAKFCTITEMTASGETAEVTLPDGSIVYMNHATLVSYQPYWWWASRAVQMEGEAFFEVVKGSQFSVYSEKGATSVLGTSFNINTRNEKYAVFCRTGRVLVESADGKINKELIPGNYVELFDNAVTQLDDITYEEICAWRNNEFSFNAISLENVFMELELTYAIEIEVSESLKSKAYTYTGNFKQPESPEETLSIICGTFNLTYERENNSKFVIIEL